MLAEIVKTTKVILHFYHATLPTKTTVQMLT